METDLIRESIGLKCKQRRDFNAEDVLRSLGIDYEYIAVDLGDIDEAESRKNRGRTTGICETTVDEYAMSHAAGAQFPAICCRRIGSKFVCAGGNHRRTAFKAAGDSSAFALVFECDDMQFVRVASMLNEREGRRTNTSERIEQAAALVRLYSHTPSDAARLLNVSESSLTQHIRREDIRDTLEARTTIRPSDIQALSGVAIDAIGRGRNTPAVANELAALAISKSVDGKALREIAQQADTLPTENERLAFIKQHQPCKKNGQSTAHRPVYRSFTSALTRMENLTEGKSSSTQLQIDQSEVSLLRKRWSSLNRLVSTILSGEQIRGNS